MIPIPVGIAGPAAVRNDPSTDQDRRHCAGAGRVRPMGQPFVGEIRMFGGNFAPAGWMLCEGATLPISENEVLFNLIGTTYGGDGQETFQLPNLASRVPNHAGHGPRPFQLRSRPAGRHRERHADHSADPEPHPHAAGRHPAARVPPARRRNNTVLSDCSSTSVNHLPAVRRGPTRRSRSPPTRFSQVGGNQPHENVQPFLCINFIISLFWGIPPRRPDQPGGAPP